MQQYCEHWATDVLNSVPQKRLHHEDGTLQAQPSQYHQDLFSRARHQLRFETNLGSVSQNSKSVTSAKPGELVSPCVILGRRCKSPGMCAKHPGSVCHQRGTIAACLSKVCYTVFVLYPVDLIWYTHDLYIYILSLLHVL